MNKKDLIAQIALRSNISRVLAGKNLEAVLGSIAEELTKGGNISIAGFGVFSIKKRAARQGRNPGNGNKINIPAKKDPFFKPAKILKKMVS